MPRMRIEKEGCNGWSAWVNPRMDRYRMACCDCGLVHDIQFRVVQVKQWLSRGRKIVQFVSARKYRVEFRARRNKRSTSALRKQIPLDKPTGMKG